MHRRLEVAMIAQWRVWLGRLGALGALTCGVIGLIVGFDGGVPAKLIMPVTLALPSGATVAAAPPPPSEPPSPPPQARKANRDE